ncbi:MAG: anti-sigma factor [Spirochaetia bacterium]
MSDEHSMRDLLPGYSLGILDEEEENTIREHLAACASCREELASFREVTGRLAAAAPYRDLPAGLEERILQGIGTLRSAPGMPAPGKPAPRRPASRSNGISLRRRGVPWPALTAVAAMLVVALGVGNFLQWTGVLQPHVRGVQPRLTTVVLAGTADARDAYGTIVLDPLDNEGVLAVTGLHGLDPRHQYQLWLSGTGSEGAEACSAPMRKAMARCCSRCPGISRTSAPSPCPSSPGAAA